MTAQNRSEDVRAPDTGVPLKRDARPFVVRYQGLQETVMLPGYYPAHEDDGDSVHLGEDLKIVEATQMKLKEKHLAASSGAVVTVSVMRDQVERYGRQLWIKKGLVRHPKTGGFIAKKALKSVRPSLWKRDEKRRQG